jgi:hypothetical protein
MKHLKRFNESLKHSEMDINKKIELIQVYSDCFQDLLDMDGIIYLNTLSLESDISTYNYIDIRDINRIKDELFSFSKGKDNSILDITILFLENNNNMKEVYDHLKKSLQADETKFKEISGVKLKNILTMVDVKVVEDRDNDMKHPSIISHSHTGGIMTNYIIDPTKKPKNGIIKKLKSFINGSVNYNFPEIHEDDSIIKIEIKHQLDMKNYITESTCFPTYEIG